MKKLESLAKVRHCDVVNFVYLSGSHPGDRRRVQIDEYGPTRSGGYVTGNDLDIQQPRKFLVNMAKDVYYEYNAVDVALDNSFDFGASRQISNPNKEISFIISANGTISLYLNNKSYLIDKNHLSYDKILEILKKDNYDSYYDLLARYVDIVKDIVNYTQQSSTISNKVEIKNGEIYYQGEVLHNCLTERIVELYRSGYPFAPMVKFLENILENPSKRAIDELYKFLEHKNLPITSDGCFLAYKKIDDDYKDMYSHTIDNSVGANPKMDRNKVCDNFKEGCSRGLHVGSLIYARDEYCPNQGRIVVCKVNPRDVVSVPDDCNCQKVRVCEYKVYSEITSTVECSTGLNNPVYAPF